MHELFGLHVLFCAICVAGAAAICTFNGIGGSTVAPIIELDFFQCCPSDDTKRESEAGLSQEYLLTSPGHHEAAAVPSLPPRIKACVAVNNSIWGPSAIARTAIEHIFELFATTPSGNIDLQLCPLDRVSVTDVRRVRSVELLFSNDDVEPTMFQWFPSGHMAPYSLGVLHTVWVDVLRGSDVIKFTVTFYVSSKHQRPRSHRFLPALVSIVSSSDKPFQSLPSYFKTTAVEFSMLNFNMWNYNGDWTARLDRFAELVAGRGGPPDVFTLQELRIDENFLGHWKTTSGVFATQCQSDHIVRMLRLKQRLQHSFLFAPAMTYFQATYHRGIEFQLEGPMIMNKFSAMAMASFYLSRRKNDEGDAHQRVLLCALLALPSKDGGTVRVDVCTVHFALSLEHRLRNSVESSRFIDELARCTTSRCVAHIANESDVLHDGPSFFPPAALSVLAGDLNAEPQDASVARLSQTEGFADAFEMWKNVHSAGLSRDEELGLTFNANDQSLVKRIDFIFLKPRNFTMDGVLWNTDVSVVEFDRLGLRAGSTPAASDHLGIAARFRIDLKQQQHPSPRRRR